MVQGRAKTDAGKLFRFFQWNDIHLLDASKEHSFPAPPGWAERADWIARASRGEADNIEKPDFVASVGDITDGAVDDQDADYRYFREHTLPALNVPFLPCLGNHENDAGEGDPTKNLGYDACFGECWHDYVYTFAGVGFVVIDTSGAHLTKGPVTARRVAFFKRAMKKLAGLPVFVISHVPLVSMRDDATLEKSFGYHSYKVADPALLDAIRAERARVIAVLSGHTHVTGIVTRDGITHVMPSGTSGYPADIGIIDVFPDRAEVVMQPVPAELLPPRIKGDIHGKERHEVDYTDAQHPDHEQYLWGNASERSITLPMPAAFKPATGAERRLTIWHETADGHWVTANPPV